MMVGWVIQGWGESCRDGMIHTGHYHHMHTLPAGNYLELLGGAKFNYNHTPNYLELLREQPQTKTWVFFVYQKEDLVKGPMKSRDVVPKNVLWMGWGGVKVDIRAQKTTRILLM